MEYVFWYDWLVGIIMIAIVLKWTNNFVKKNHDSPLIVSYFKYGLLLKIFGSISFTIYHAYIYGGGDTFGYFFTGKDITTTAFTDFTKYLRLIFLPLENIQEDIASITWRWDDAIMVKGEANYFSGRMVALLSLFTLNTYLPTCILFSLFSYVFIWKCYNTFTALFNNSKKILSIPFLFVPTVIFWGSGLGKDSICLAAICGLTNYSFKIIFLKQYKLKYLFLSILFFSIINIVKPYISLAFLSGLSVGLFFLFIQKANTTIGKFLRTVISGGLLVVSFSLATSFISTNFKNFSIDTLSDKIVSSNQNLQATAGSSFDLGIDPKNVNDLNDLAPFFHKGITASLFRPWLTEATNPALLLSALEGLLFLLAFVYIMLKGLLYRPIKIIFSNPVLIICMCFVLIFSGLVGLSTSNFGTLVRYKLPCIPFFICTLVILYDKLKKKNNGGIENNEKGRMLTL
jgi:hypothetical protein